jgi:hypothetical protein
MNDTGILYTTEIRWFTPGIIPTEVIDWFTGTYPLTPLERVDRYLRMPGCQTAGVKERQSRFEIKAMCGDPTQVRFGPKTAGYCDNWAKWSYSKPEVESWINALREERSGWIEVGKSRILRKFTLESGGPIEVGADGFPAEGCNLELVEINAEDIKWWSIGFEAYSEQGNRSRNLELTAIDFFNQHPPPLSLDETNSYAYPTWLNIVLFSGKSNP